MTPEPWVACHQDGPGSAFEVVCLPTPPLGDRSYLATDGEVAVAVDPQRDLDRILAVLDGRRVRLTHVVETHVHNDYVSGGLELASLTGARHVLGAGDPVAYPHLPVEDGDHLATGRLQLRVVHTPGHTLTHVTYLLEVDDRLVAAFTGGSLLVGAVGRTDLITPGATAHLSRLQYRSARRLAASLGDDVAILPTHGFGSFCAPGVNAPDPDRVAFMGEERASNPALQDDETAFVAGLVGTLDAFPRYYAYMAPRNRAGPTAIDLSPLPLTDPAELQRRARLGEWVLDLRNRRQFAAGHLPGTVNFEFGDLFATYVGWLLPWGSPVSLLGPDPVLLLDAQRALARIGIDRPAACALLPPGGEGTTTYPVQSFGEVTGILDRPGHVVLDVRRVKEWEAGHLPGALHIPIHELADRIGEIPDGEVWVHCAAGYRAAIAASLLDRAGRSAVLVDGELAGAGRSGLQLVAAGS